MQSVKQVAVAAALMAAVSAGAAHAAPLTYGAVTIWNAATPGANSGSASEQALFNNPLVSAGNKIYSSTYTGPLDFALNSGNNTVANFLATGSGSFGSSTSGLTQTMSAGGFSVATVFDFAFTTTSALNLTVSHDDGFSIANAANSATLVDYSSPNIATAQSFTLGAGNYNLWYVEANGLPADLLMSAKAVPEPASMALLVAGVAGLGVLRRRRRSVSAT